MPITGSYLSSGLSETAFPSGAISSPAGPGGFTSAYSGPLANVSFIGEPFVMFLGLVALLGLLKYFGEHAASPINPAHVHIGGYNWMTVGVTAVTFIALFKMLLIRYPIPGLSQVFGFV